MKVQVKDEQGIDEAGNKHPAPGIDDGTHECELKWEWKDAIRGNWFIVGSVFLNNEGNPIKFITDDFQTQKIWVLTEQKLPETGWEIIGNPLDTDPAYNIDLEQEKDECINTETCGSPIKSNLKENHLKKVYAVRDDDAHWYIIPFEMKSEFQSDLDGLCDDNIYEWEDKYGKYMTGGDLNLIQLYANI